MTQSEFPFPELAEREDLIDRVPLPKGKGVHPNVLAAVLRELGRYRESFEKQQRIASRLRLCRDQVRRAVKILSQLGYITCEKKYCEAVEATRNHSRVVWEDVRRAAESGKCPPLPDKSESTVATNPSERCDKSGVSVATNRDERCDKSGVSVATNPGERCDNSGIRTLYRKINNLSHRSTATTELMRALEEAGCEQPVLAIEDAEQRGLTDEQLLEAAYVVQHTKELKGGALLYWIRRGGWPRSGVRSAEEIYHSRCERAESIRQQARSDAKSHEKSNGQPLPDWLVGGVIAQRLTDAGLDDHLTQQELENHQRYVTARTSEPEKSRREPASESINPNAESSREMLERMQQETHEQ